MDKTQKKQSKEKRNRKKTVELLNRNLSVQPYPFFELTTAPGEEAIFVLIYCTSIHTIVLQIANSTVEYSALKLGSFTHLDEARNSSIPLEKFVGPLLILKGNE
ncbi:hypothetical protein NE237_010061 [Protea cynaroides]|uniref:Uncharacterized protein n=1 Tax=Protea cynaroides TaxID=273540 RepID=A0A9Q0KZU3_9MAGN|nr:hypothetical protein NE237_010061 [Protea cynaroides]